MRNNFTFGYIGVLVRHRLKIQSLVHRCIDPSIIHTHLLQKCINKLKTRKFYICLTSLESIRYLVAIGHVGKKIYREATEN